MATLAFDTHAFVKELTQAGMPEAQAEVLARSQATLIDEKLATKQDLKELEARLRHDMKELELRLTIPPWLHDGRRHRRGRRVSETAVSVGSTERA